MRNFSHRNPPISNKGMNRFRTAIKKISDISLESDGKIKQVTTTKKTWINSLNLDHTTNIMANS